MAERNRNQALEVDENGRVIRDVVDTIGAVPGEDQPVDISGGPGEGTGWGAWRAEHPSGADEPAKEATSANDQGQGKAKRDKKRTGGKHG